MDQRHTSGNAPTGPYVKLIWAEPLARLDYLAVAHPTTLDEVRRVRGRVVLLLAVWIGETRLIDNLVVNVR